jgi:ADP-ribose pyrophosphatase
MPIQIEVVRDHTAETPSDKGFIKVRRLELKTVYDDGTRSESYRYDVADREAIDAVLMVLHAERPGAPEDPLVCMRTALRPPLALRRGRALVVPDRRDEPVLWEMPAGLIETDAKGERGVMETASRETEEETGLSVPPDRFARLGVEVFLSPGLVAEKLHVVHARVDHTKAQKATATETVEQASRVEWWPLSDALARAARGEVEDCKTELALHRLRALFAPSPGTSSSGA